MRTLTLTLGIAALLIAATSAAGAQTKPKPTLHVLAGAPVQFEGTSFKQRELVRVTLSINGEQATRRVRASLRGAFAIVFSGAEIADRCSSDVWARAVGARGSLATAKLPQLLCPPRLTPRP